MTRTEFKSALEDILGVRRGSLKDSDTRDTVSSWSSLADVQIVALIASTFAIEPDAEMLEAESVGDLLQALENRNAF